MGYWERMSSSSGVHLSGDAVLHHPPLPPPLHGLNFHVLFDSMQIFKGSVRLILMPSNSSMLLRTMLVRRPSDKPSIPTHPHVHPDYSEPNAVCMNT